VTDLIVGVDVGGSKTLAQVEGGESPGRSTGPGAAIRPGRALASGAIIVDVIRRALRDAGGREARAVVIGVAGGGRPEDRRELERYVRSEGLTSTVRATTDGEIALTAAFGEQPGVVVIAGTGSIVLGRTADGAIHRQGGYGWQMGDDGSGYAIGRAALRAVGEAHDGRGPATALEPAVLDASHSASFEKLVRWSVEASPAEIAALAPAATAAAEAGDATARTIVDHAAEALVDLVVALVEHAPIPPPVSVAFAGGMLTAGAVRAALDARIARDDRLRRLAEDVEPVLGAVALARMLVTAG